MVLILAVCGRAQSVPPRFTPESRRCGCSNWGVDEEAKSQKVPQRPASRNKRFSLKTIIGLEYNGLVVEKGRENAKKEGGKNGF